MINSMEMSRAMQMHTDRAISYMKREGYIFPSLVILNKGEDLNIDISHPHLYGEGSRTEQGIEPFADEESQIYKKVLAFRLSPEYRDRYMVEVAKKIAQKYKPDAIGAISACLFKELPRSQAENRKEGAIQTDPEAVRMFYVSFYLKGDRNPNYMLIPYLLNDREDFSFGDEENYTVSTVRSSWKRGEDETVQILPYPYSLF